jgi:hypothetical protein
VLVDSVRGLLRILEARLGSVTRRPMLTREATAHDEANGKRCARRATKEATSALGHGSPWRGRQRRRCTEDTIYSWRRSRAPAEAHRAVEEAMGRWRL